MEAKTLKALKGSIRKWKQIAAGKGVDKATDNCALCKLFHSPEDNERDLWCAGCPVMERTGKNGCEGTPYQRWSHLTDFAYGAKADTPELKKVAEDELAFLQSLLPDETKGVIRE